MTLEELLKNSDAIVKDGKTRIFWSVAGWKVVQEVYGKKRPILHYQGDSLSVAICKFATLTGAVELDKKEGE